MDNPLVASLLNPAIPRTALVKIQGPFTDNQLDSVARGMAHLQKLGLVSVIVVDRDDYPPPPPNPALDEEQQARAREKSAKRQRTLVLRDVERVVDSLVKHRAPARPILATVARMTGPCEASEIIVETEGVDHIRRAVEEGEIPVLLPVALDEGCRSRRVQGDLVIGALCKAMSASSSASTSEVATVGKPVDLTPLRLLIINREGGIPSYARHGLPHLSINLASEYDFIQSTFRRSWESTHPTARANLRLANDCLSLMPRGSSALIVSHRSPAALIANLITNKPAHSASLPHALLVESEGRVTPHTPTLIRTGLPIRIMRSMDELDKSKLTKLLEKSFGRILNEEAFYARLERDLDFVIVAGDYVGAAVCTIEGKGDSSEQPEGICYLDKFAVLPQAQGDGTVDFLWVALRDETYGLGLQDAANSNEGSLGGVGNGRDLVWRSRADNPVNKWYFERSSGFVTRGTWKMFWCDAEQRMREYARTQGDDGARIVMCQEKGRLERWGPVIERIPSAWRQ